MPRPRAVPSPELKNHIKRLKRTRGALTALATQAEVGMGSLARVAAGEQVETDTLTKLEAVLALAPAVPVLHQSSTAHRAVNGIAHLEAFTGALIDGMEFMRLQVLRYLQKGADSS